jgi:hypothetical protein
MRNNGFIEQLRKELPPVFGRPAISKILPGVIDPKTLANLASLGEGPPYQMVRRRCVYDRESFLDWLQEQVR